jgi:hypothetical protein
MYPAAAASDLQQAEQGTAECIWDYFTTLFQIHNLCTVIYSSTDVIMLSKWRKMRLAGHFARTKEMRNA